MQILHTCGHSETVVHVIMPAAKELGKQSVGWNEAIPRQANIGMENLD